MMQFLLRPPRAGAALLAFALASYAVLAHAAVPSPDASSSPQPIQQLRTYEIFESNKAQFHARFRDHAARIMRRHGFDIVAMWETRFQGRTEFAYLLQWPDEATMRERWAAFMADEEWTRIKRETRVHGAMVGQIEDRTLVPVDYSPTRAFPASNPVSRTP